MSESAKPARLQYYIDADLLGLAKILVDLRPDVTYPGDPGGMTRNKRVRGAVHDRRCRHVRRDMDTGDRPAGMARHNAG
jgi:hypothetical protein